MEYSQMAIGHVDITVGDVGDDCWQDWFWSRVHHEAWFRSPLKRVEAVLSSTAR